MMKTPPSRALAATTLEVVPFQVDGTKAIPALGPPGWLGGALDTLARADGRQVSVFEGGQAPAEEVARQGHDRRAVDQECDGRA